MRRFIETRAGLVNLDHVVRIEEDEPTGHHLLFDANGNTLGVTWVHNLTDLCGTIVSAAPGTFAFIFDHDALSERPTAENVYSTLTPVIGWRIGPGERIPVLLETARTEHEWLVIQMPTGQLFGMTGEGFDTLDQAQTRFLADRQDEWDSTNAAKPSDAAKDAAEPA